MSRPSVLAAAVAVRDAMRESKHLADSAYREHMAKLSAAIDAAVDDGWSKNAVAAAFGVTRTRLDQMILAGRNAIKPVTPERGREMEKGT